MGLILFQIQCAYSGLYVAIFPLITGILSTSKGIHILPYMNIALGCTISVLWAMSSKIPSLSRVNTGDDPNPSLRLAMQT